MSSDLSVSQAVTDLTSADRRKRIGALNRLRGEKHPDIAAVIALLDDPDDEIRRLAAEVLGLNGDPAAVPALIEALSDDVGEVRAAAANALLQIGTPQALSAVGVTSEEVDDQVRGIPFDRLREFQEEEDLLEATPEIPRSVPPPAPAPVIPPAGALTPKAAADVRFSTYYPREVMPNIWHPMRAYVFRASAADKVARDAADALGSLDPFREVSRDSRTAIAEGALITAAPHIDGFQFNPPQASVYFYEDWHHYEFKLRAVSAPLDQSSNGRVTFTVEGVIVAEVPLSIFVGGSVPLASGSTANTTSKLYQAVFCSYSHRDTQIVERVERAYKALGLDYLRDIVSLKSGQEWNAQLLKLIEKADIFQLFWSKAAAESKYVRQEWQHALSLNRGSAAFIRPVYWDQPMPPVPPELGHLHFAYQPDLDD